MAERFCHGCFCIGGLAAYGAGTNHLSCGREQCLSLLVCREAAAGGSILRGPADHPFRGGRRCGDPARHHHGQIHSGEAVRHCHRGTGGESAAEVSGSRGGAVGLGDISCVFRSISGDSPHVHRACEAGLCGRSLSGCDKGAGGAVRGRRFKGTAPIRGGRGCGPRGGGADGRCHPGGGSPSSWVHRECGDFNEQAARQDGERLCKAGSDPYPLARGGAGENVAASDRSALWVRREDGGATDGSRDRHHRGRSGGGPGFPAVPPGRKGRSVHLPRRQGDRERCRIRAERGGQELFQRADNGRGCDSGE